jgi:polysaccharide biosynthesis/export protein
MTDHLKWLVAAAFVAAFGLLPVELVAQQRDTSDLRTDPRLHGMSEADVLQRLRASGMTRQQVRAELQRRGYDPSLADRYFDLLERGGARREGGDFVDALTATGLAVDPRAPVQRDTLAAERLLTGDVLDLEALFGLTSDDLVEPAELAVFGTSFFRRGIGSLDEPAFGPVADNYRLGPGDEVNVILTGAVQDAYPLRISREGTLVVPDVGEVVVRGLTVSALEDLLRARFADVYASGLTRVSVALGRVRGIQVYVIGDVERPGPYQISGVGTVLNALYRAGGPSRTGSFREIELRRGNQLVRRLDLYDYLLHGNSQADARLEHGDVLFVPPVARRVRLEGAVRRPALYELVEGDGLRDAIRFAGGPEAEAALRRVQIDRVVSPLEQTPGVERVLLDVDVLRLLDAGESDVPLRDGDRVHVHSVGDERRHMVTIVGEVRRPGAYAWAAGTTLSDVVDRASGTTESAFVDRAHVFRLDPATGERRMLSASLATADGRSTVLEDRDSVVVYGRERLRPREYVTVGGLVKRPGRYLLVEGATVRDMILTAGGFAEGAYRSEVYVARPNLTETRTDTTAQTFRIPLVNSHDNASSAPPSWDTGAGDFVLRHADVVEIRQAPGYEVPGSVVLAGEVVLPGRYVLESRAERLGTLLSAAGGFTTDARPEGVHVVRDGRTLSAGGGNRHDVILQDGDSVRVPRLDPTVLVVGAVVHDSSRVVLRPGMNVKDVIREAGGFTMDADRNRLTVTFQNGQRGTVRRVPLFRDRQPPVEPGSTVYVPERPPGMREGVNWTSLLAQVVALTGGLATLIIALNQ